MRTRTDRPAAVKVWFYVGIKFHVDGMHPDRLFQRVNNYLKIDVDTARGVLYCAGVKRSYRISGDWQAVRCAAFRNPSLRALASSPVLQIKSMKTPIKNNPVLTEHRLTWRMWHPVYIYAFDKASAIAEALRTKPAHIPIGTELYYGMVAGTPVAVAA